MELYYYKVMNDSFTYNKVADNDIQAIKEIEATEAEVEETIECIWAYEFDFVGREIERIVYPVIKQTIEEIK